jgi:integrase
VRQPRALRWQDVDFAKALVHVRRNYTHGAERSPTSGRVRSVPLIDQAARALDGLSRRDRFTGADDLVFVDEAGGHVDDWRLRNRFHDALDKAGLPRLRLHELRHTFGTLAVQAFPLSDVKAFMGHADIATTMVYVHHLPQLDAADRLSRLVAAAESMPRLRPVSGHVRDTVADADDAEGAESGTVTAIRKWARLDSNQGPTDYESAALTS